MLIQTLCDSVSCICPLGAKFDVSILRIFAHQSLCLVLQTYEQHQSDGCFDSDVSLERRTPHPSFLGFDSFSSIAAGFC